MSYTCFYKHTLFSVYQFFLHMNPLKILIRMLYFNRICFGQTDQKRSIKESIRNKCDNCQRLTDEKQITIEQRYK